MNPLPAPNPRTLKRCWPWQSHPPGAPDLARLAHHEAGHVVMLEWLGVPGGITATATPANGFTHHGIKPGTHTGGPPYESGEITAMAASVFHAGLMAELIFTGVEWTTPLYYPWAEDYQRANDMLRERFGNHSSAGHAFAQRTALHELSVRWSRVKEIADVLVRCGAWP